MTPFNLNPTNLETCPIATRRDGAKGRVVAYLPNAGEDFQILVLWEDRCITDLCSSSGKWRRDGQRSSLDIVSVEEVALDDRAELYDFMRDGTLGLIEGLDDLLEEVGNELFPGLETTPTAEQLDAVVREAKKRWEARP